VNQQQKLLIQVLCDAYNSPGDRGRLFALLQNQFSEKSPHFPSPAKPSEDNFTDSQGADRIRELERQLHEQDEAFRLLQNRLQEYNDIARHYEDELAKVGEGNARLLQSFQQKAEFSTEFGSVHEREQLLEEVQEQINTSKGEYEILQKKVAQTKKELTERKTEDPELKRQIEQQELIIADLTQEIDQAKEIIAQLKRQNQALRDRLENTDSETG
jgi:chromosome segregation ATPase